MHKNSNKSQSAVSSQQSAKKGFTLMEILVATTIFAVAVSSLLSLFNYVLKINRRSEALSQASEGMRNFIEFLAKEIQNGQIDYYVVNGQTYSTGLGPCVPPGVAGAAVGSSAPSTYLSQENKLGIINTDGSQECIYYSQPNGTYAGNSVFNSSGGATSLEVLQNGGSPQTINPLNFKIDNLMFLIRPLCDPYTTTCSAYSGGEAKIQPYVTIIIKFTATLPTGESVPIYYQTSVSSNKYDIPNH